MFKKTIRTYKNIVTICNLINYTIIKSFLGVKKMEHHLDLFSDITVPKKLNSIRKSNSLVRIHKLVDMSVFPHLVNKVNPPQKNTRIYANKGYAYQKNRDVLNQK